MLPNVSDALAGWTMPLLVKTITTTRVDFVDTEIVTGDTIDAVVQPTEKTKLNADTLDWSQRHITLHSTTPLKKGQLVEYKGADYKVVEGQDWLMCDYDEHQGTDCKVVEVQDWTYGYFEAVCEATNRALVEVTE